MGHRIASLPGWRHLAFLATIVLLSGCLTIEEHYTFKKDGSGTMEYVMDMSAIGELINSLASEGDDGDKEKKKKKTKDDDDSMASGTREQVAQLKKLSGIKQVKLKEEKEGYVQRVSFGFADLAALNRALNILMPDSANADQEFFRWEGTTLVRTNNRYAESLGAEMSSDEEDPAKVAEVLSSMKYKLSFSFANAMGDVQLGEGMAKEQPGPKQLELSTDFSEIAKDPKVLDLRIGFTQ